MWYRIILMTYTHVAINYVPPASNYEYKPTKLVLTGYIHESLNREQSREITRFCNNFSVEFIMLPYSGTGMAAVSGSNLLRNLVHLNLHNHAISILECNVSHGSSIIGPIYMQITIIHTGVPWRTSYPDLFIASFFYQLRLFFVASPLIINSRLTMTWNVLNQSIEVYTDKK